MSEEEEEEMLKQEVKCVVAGALAAEEGSRSSGTSCAVSPVPMICVDLSSSEGGRVGSEEVSPASRSQS